jgi:hypothetical protein
MHALYEQRPVGFSPTPAFPSPQTLYADANDRQRHAHNIERLAQEVNYPVQVIETLYEETLARLKTSATIHDYLPILVAKGVRQALKETGRRH